CPRSRSRPPLTTRWSIGSSKPSKALRAPARSATERSSSPRSNRWFASAPAKPARKRSEPASHTRKITDMKKLIASLLLGLGMAFAGVSAVAQTAEAPAAIEAPAEAAAAPAADAAPAEAAPAADEPKVDSGDTAWMMTSTLLVILMTIPGLALFYGGLTRSKNMLSVLMQVAVIFSLSRVQWSFCGSRLGFAGEG